MIRRAVAGSWTRANEPIVDVPDAVPAREKEPLIGAEQLDAMLAAAYERGRNEAFDERDKEDRSRHASEADRVETAERSLNDARSSLVELQDGLADAIARHAASMEALAVDLACAAAVALVRPLVIDASAVAAMCRQMVEEAGDSSASLEVSSADVSLLPTSINGIKVTAVEGMRRGRCVLSGGRGSVHADIGKRLEALVHGFLEVLERPTA